MNNTKLINLLRTFSKTEMKEFEKMAASPFFNNGRNYLPFLKEIKKFYPAFNDNKMTYEYIFSKLYPGKKFNKQIIWNMNSALLNMTEEFLIHSSLKKDKFLRNSQIGTELLDRKLGGLYAKKIDEMETELDKIGIGSYYYQYKTLLEASRIRYHFLEDAQHLVPPHIVKKGEYAILNFLRLISGVISDMKSNIAMFNARFDTNIPFEFINNLQLDKIIEYAKAHNYHSVDIMEMYYCTAMMSLKPTDTSYFFKFKELFEKNADKFETEEKKNWLTLLANYCSERVNTGGDYYRQMLFEVNMLQLKEIEGSRKKDLGKILYLQIIRNALTIDQIDWVKKYIETYTPFLKHSYQKSMRALANSFLFFKLNDFSTVIENLGKVKFFDTRDKFFVKSLYLRAYYELGEIPTLMYHIDSAKQFVSKNPSLAKTTRENFSKFINYLSRLLLFSENKNDYELQALKNEIENDKSVINGAWLEEKINEIIRGD